MSTELIVWHDRSIVLSSLDARQFVFAVALLPIFYICLIITMAFKITSL